VQLFAFRQATFGHEALNRIQARWAARAGVEATIAMMELHTEQPIPDDAFAIINDMEFVSSSDFLSDGPLHDTVYSVMHHVEGVDYNGPMDESSRININRTDASLLDLLDDMTPDVLSAIIDWVDEDDEPGMLGAEYDHYLALESPYKPRNGPLRSIAEMELIAGIWPEVMRGEDWNFNNRLDPNEDDGRRTLPEDQPDGYMEVGWASKLTAYSTDNGASGSGEPRIYLRHAIIEDLMDRCGIDEPQARALKAFGRNQDNVLEQLIVTPLNQIDPNTGEAGGGESNPAVAPLTDDQLLIVLQETTMYPLFERVPGRINLNTASQDLIEDILEVRGYDEVIADEIIYMRNSRPQGITSLLDLNEIPDLSPEMLLDLAQLFTTWSNVYTITSRGRSLVSGLEVEMIVVVDRSTVPARILEYREQ
jgi:DNA uptake protein ComE-like DNA-binding protein